MLRPEQPTLSILIPTLYSRLDSFARLVREIERQSASAGGLPVEVVALYDNKWSSVGEKRNRLISSAHGTFLSFVDDDDRLSPEYLVEILSVVKDRPDAEVIVFEQMVSIKGRTPKRCVYGVEYKYTETKDLWTGLPAHTMVWRTEVARRAAFPDRNCGEDTAWVKDVCRYVDPAKQVRINKVLYFYDQDPDKTETQRR